MSIDVLDEDYSNIVNRVIELSKTNMNLCYGLFKDFISIATENFDFISLDLKRSDEWLISIAKLNGFENYRLISTYFVDTNNISIKLLVDETSNGFANVADPMEASDKSVIKYYQLSYDKDECNEFQINRCLNYLVECIKEHHESQIKLKVDHSITSDTFTKEIKKLLCKDDRYLFTRSITEDQENYQYLSRFKEKINQHPKLWKWFFELP